MSTDTRRGAGGTREDTGSALPLRNDGGNGGGVNNIPVEPAPEVDGPATALPC